jgi:hypothetical protein
VAESGQVSDKTLETTMRQRYFLIEPQYSDPDTFCHLTVGSDRVRASIQIYANIPMLLGAASALEAESISEEWLPVDEQCRAKDDEIFDFQLAVMPHEEGKRVLRFGIFQDWLDDGAPFRADIRFPLNPDDAAQFAKELRAWCSKPEYAFIWKGN